MEDRVSFEFTTKLKAELVVAKNANQVRYVKAHGDFNELGKLKHKMTKELLDDGVYGDVYMHISRAVDKVEGNTADWLTPKIVNRNHTFLADNFSENMGLNIINHHLLNGDFNRINGVTTWNKKEKLDNF